MQIPQKFFSRSAIEVAPDLIGCTLVRKFANGKILRGIIVETEAYLQTDPACHAYRGITNRNQVMFGPAGCSYVYFIYGVHFCLNVVTGLEGQGEAVLIRALDFLQDKEKNQGENYDTKIDMRIASGPGKLCHFLKIDKSLNGIPLFLQHDGIGTSKLWIENKNKNKKIPLVQCQRIGIRLAKDLLWRWYWKGNQAVSRP